MRDSFRREVAVLQHFAGIGAHFVPHLIDYDDKSLWYETERIPDTEPLCHRMATLPSNLVDAVISELLAIDRKLYLHEIDYRAVSIDHILIDENGGVFLTGFAHSRINHPLEDILFDSVFELLDRDAHGREMTRAFLATLAIRREEVYRLFIRTLRRAVHEFFRGGRGQPMVEI